MRKIDEARSINSKCFINCPSDGAFSRQLARPVSSEVIFRNKWYAICIFVCSSVGEVRSVLGRKQKLQHSFRSTTICQIRSTRVVWCEKRIQSITEVTGSATLWYVYISGSQTFLTAGQIWFFKYHGGPQRCRAPSVSLHDGRLRAPSAHTSSFKRIWEVYPVASFEFYKKASQVCPLLSTQAQVHPTWRAPSRAQTPYSPFFSTTTLPNPPRT